MIYPGYSDTAGAYLVMLPMNEGTVTSFIIMPSVVVSVPPPSHHQCRAIIGGGGGGGTLIFSSYVGSGPVSTFNTPKTSGILSTPKNI